MGWTAVTLDLLGLLGGILGAEHCLRQASSALAGGHLFRSVA